MGQGCHMQRELLMRVLPEPSRIVEEGSRTTTTFVLSLMGSLAQTYGAVWLMCRTPWSGTLTWAGLFRTAVFFLVITMAANAFAVWSNRRIFRGLIDGPAGPLMLAMWPTVVWVPLLVLLLREQSAGMVLLPPLMAASATISLKRWRPQAAGSAATSFGRGDLSTLFHVERSRSLLRLLAPALVTATILHAAVAEMGLDHPLIAGWLFAFCVAGPLWVYRAGVERCAGERTAGPSLHGVLRHTLAVFLLLGFALIPYLRSSRLVSVMTAALRAKPSPPPSASEGKSSRAPNTSYTGVILTLPPQQRHTVAVPVAPKRSESGVRRRPVILLFDGVYWYFRQPDRRPRADAPVVQGDPRRRDIRSTDMRPLSMEAHQLLPSPVRMDCCSAIRVSIENAEREAGVIFVEVLLRDRTLKESAPISLGSVPIASSESTESRRDRAPVDEVLRFPLPLHARRGRFDEIDVVIRPTGERARRGAHIAVQWFELTP